MSGIGGGNFNYGAVGSSLGQGTRTAETNLRDFSRTMDTGSTADMIRMQSMTQQWSVAVNLESNLIKTIGDALKGIVQKVG